jgi:hypothetical protein
MLFRVVLIFPNVKNLSGFVEQIEVAGEVDGSICTFAGTLNEEQVTIARKSFGAYIRLLRLIENS